MEYVDGCSLDELRKTKATLPVEDVVNYGIQALRGLQHIADSGLVHRDIKPGNLLVDKQGTIKILDLGLARFTDERSDNLTVQQGVEILGTVDFMAPEQSLDGPWVDHRADIYSLGASLYFMLTGKTPLPDGPSHSKILAAQIHVPTRMSQIRPEIDPRLEEIVGKMMAKTPDRRYQHARDVIAALIAWQKNAPVNLTRQPAIETPADHVSGRSTASAALHSRPTWVKPTSGPIVEEPLQAERSRRIGSDDSAGFPAAFPAHFGNENSTTCSFAGNREVAYPCGGHSWRGFGPAGITVEMSFPGTPISRLAFSGFSSFTTSYPSSVSAEQQQLWRLADLPVFSGDALSSSSAHLRDFP